MLYLVTTQRHINIPILDILFSAMHAHTRARTHRVCAEQFQFQLWFLSERCTFVGNVVLWEMQSAPPLHALLHWIWISSIPTPHVRPGVTAQHFFHYLPPLLLCLRIGYKTNYCIMKLTFSLCLLVWNKYGQNCVSNVYWIVTINWMPCTSIIQSSTTKKIGLYCVQ